MKSHAQEIAPGWAKVALEQDESAGSCLFALAVGLIPLRFKQIFRWHGPGQANHKCLSNMAGLIMVPEKLCVSIS